MAWTIEIDLPAEKELEKLDRQQANRVVDYRIIASLEDHIARILVVKIGNHKEVYR